MFGFGSDEDDTANAAAAKAPTEPIEPNGHDLTDHRDHLAWVRSKMEKVAEQINARLRATAERQQYVRDTDATDEHPTRRRSARRRQG